MQEKQKPRDCSLPRARASEEMDRLNKKISKVMD